MEPKCVANPFQNHFQIHFQNIVNALSNTDKVFNETVAGRLESFLTVLNEIMAEKSLLHAPCVSNDIRFGSIESQISRNSNQPILCDKVILL